jgi:seryl-tRNA synthetase
MLGRFDRLIRRIAVEAFGAEEREYNSLIPSEYLRRAGYFSSFGHSLTFAFHLQEDLDRIEAFATRHNEATELNFESIDELTTPEYCLSPAVCYHAYGAMIDQQLDEPDHGLRVETAGGRCFRYESKNITALDRLWEFTMREIIFIGEKKRVVEARRRAIDIIWRLIERMDLTASLETAADPFFATDFRSLRFFQLVNELKYELRLPVDESSSVAAASFNYHESFFGQKFGIHTIRGSQVHTGCAAFGLERLALAAMAQLGFDQTCHSLDGIEADLPALTQEDNQ